MTFTVDIHHHMLPDFFWRATNEGDRPVGGIAPPPWSRVSTLSFLDDAGIDVAVTSISTPGVHADDDSLAQTIAANLAIYGHPTATAPMGGSDDPWAVVDSVGAVKGISGLRVVDASIIPEVPSSTTNVTVIMLAERIYQRVYAS